MTQRVLSRAEYAALGYVERGDLSTVRLSMTPDKPLASSNIPAYRASSKEQYYLDYGTGITKVGFAISSGGTSAGFKTGVTYLFSLLT